MKYFVAADIHGYFDEFMLALNEKGFDLNNPDHKIILCGDLLDRGPKSKEVIEFVLKNKEKIIFVRGNHEDLMQDAIDRNLYTTSDISNGVAGTLIELYPDIHNTKLSYKEIAKLTGLQEFLDLTVDYFETEHYVFVHAWFPVNIIAGKPAYHPDWRTAPQSLWKQARWLNPVEMNDLKIFEPNKTIVCGHWHCSAFWHAQNPEKYEEFGYTSNFSPFITPSLIALDACTSFSSFVNVLILED